MYSFLWLGVRIFGENTPSTEQLEAKALSFQRDMIDVYSNSWGPGDSGWEFTRLGPRLKETLEKGTRLVCLIRDL